MLDVGLLLPEKIDRTFRGSKWALWFFFLVTGVTLWRSQHHLFAADGGAESIATIPLDEYSSGASETIVGIFALWGLSQLIIGIIYLFACVRYRSLIPLLYLLGIVEYAARAFYIGASKPIETAGDAPGAVANIPFMVVFAVMWVLSLWRGRNADGSNPA